MNTRKVGDENEQVVVEFLERSGYRVLERNVTCRYGEVDIIAQHGQVLCFVEVRSRATDVWGDPSMTVSGSKQRKVVQAAMHYLSRRGSFEHEMRFDVASVVGRGRTAKVEYIPAAFDAGF